MTKIVILLSLNIHDYYHRLLVKFRVVFKKQTFGFVDPHYYIFLVLIFDFIFIYFKFYYFILSHPYTFFGFVFAVIFLIPEIYF